MLITNLLLFFLNWIPLWSNRPIVFRVDSIFPRIEQGDKRGRSGFLTGIVGMRTSHETPRHHPESVMGLQKCIYGLGMDHGNNRLLKQMKTKMARPKKKAGGNWAHPGMGVGD